MDKAIGIRLKPMPLDQRVEGCHRERQARLEIFPNPVPNLLQVTHPRQHEQNRFDGHPDVPSSAQTYFSDWQDRLLSHESLDQAERSFRLRIGQSNPRTAASYTLVVSQSSHDQTELASAICATTPGSPIAEKLQLASSPDCSMVSVVKCTPKAGQPGY